LDPLLEHRDVRFLTALSVLAVSSLTVLAQEPAARQTAAPRTERVARAEWQPARPRGGAGVLPPRLAAVRQQAEPLPTPSTPPLAPTPAPEADMAVGESYVDSGESLGDVVLGEGEFIVGPNAMSSGGSSCDGIGCDGCDACAYPYGWRKCICIWMPSDGWVRAEYLSAYLTGADTPPLVTTSPQGTPRGAAGVLGRDTTTILFGGTDDSVSDQRGGFRIRFGTYFDPWHRWGLQAEAFNFESQTASYDASSSGNPILTRPFFNMLTAAQDSEIVAYPNVATGNVDASYTQRFMGAGFHLRHLLCGREPCPADWTNLMSGHSQRLDGVIGYRYLQLSEQVSVREDLTSTDPTDPGRFVIDDDFMTRALFNGIDLGVIYTGRRDQWNLEVLYRLGLGNTNQSVQIDGSTVTTVGANSETYTGGLLAQRSNIGNYSYEQFSVVPEIGITLGYQITPKWQLTAGYTFLYWTNVVRAAEQIDLDVNPNLLPPETVPFTGPLRPSFDLQTANLLVQAISVGAELRW
jgi:hypothetical protein